MKERSLLFCCLLRGEEKTIENTQLSIAIEGPMLRRAVREHRRLITRTIGDTITSNKHRRCLHEHVGNDRSSLCLRHFGPSCTSLNVHRLLCAVRRYIADKSCRRNTGRKIQSMHWNFFSKSRCLGEAWRLLAYVADHLPNYWRVVELPCMGYHKDHCIWSLFCPVSRVYS